LFFGFVFQGFFGKNSRIQIKASTTFFKSGDLIEKNSPWMNLFFDYDLSPHGKSNVLFWSHKFQSKMENQLLHPIHPLSLVFISVENFVYFVFVDFLKTKKRSNKQNSFLVLETF